MTSDAAQVAYEVAEAEHRRLRAQLDGWYERMARAERFVLTATPDDDMGAVAAAKAEIEVLHRAIEGARKPVTLAGGRARALRDRARAGRSA